MSSTSLHSDFFLFLFAFFLLFNISLQGQEKKNFNSNAYTKTIDNWHKVRVSELKQENGWLNLAGLFWLEEGKNSFGSDSVNSIIFPPRKIPGKAGYFVRSGDSVSMICATGVRILLNGQPVEKATVYKEGSSDSAVLRYGTLKWTLIKRGDKIGIRLRDLAHPNQMYFTGIDRFPVDDAWRVEAQLEPMPAASFIPITNVLGQTTPQASPGKLTFKWKDSWYSLDALQEGNELFILFADETNAISTYGSGRFLYAGLPDANGKTVLDFNKAINPPCAFTPFATCPLPPPQNRLSIAVTAGEKAYHTR
jgi:uncharacterized protein (DUF1684 family)